MSNHNYSQYSNKNRNDQKPHERKQVQQPKPQFKSAMKTPEIKTDPAEAIPKVELVQETVETKPLPNTVKGVVAHCAKLNVRENATVDSGIVCVLDVMSEVEIDVRKSSTNWAYVYTASGAEGYCMRQYVDARM